MDYQLRVCGTPKPKGSWNTFYNKKVRRCILIPASKSKPWEKLVAMAALDAGVEKLEGPVAVDMTFFMHRPKSVSFEKRAVPCVMPDIDKLARSILDALTGVAYKDDGQVVDLIARKRYDDREEQGVIINISEY